MWTAELLNWTNRSDSDPIHIAQRAYTSMAVSRNVKDGQHTKQIYLQYCALSYCLDLDNNSKAFRQLQDIFKTRTHIYIHRQRRTRNHKQCSKFSDYYVLGRRITTVCLSQISFESKSLKNKETNFQFSNFLILYRFCFCSVFFHRNIIITKQTKALILNYNFDLILSYFFISIYFHSFFSLYIVFFRNQTKKYWIDWITGELRDVFIDKRLCFQRYP